MFKLKTNRVDPSTLCTKRAFWSRFPTTKLVCMQAILRSGQPPLLAGQLSTLQLLVSDSPFVDVTLDQTTEGIASLASTAYPETVSIDGTVLPLRLTAEEAANILNLPVGKEVYVAPLTEGV
jgi:hypothetical protein